MLTEKDIKQIEKLGIKPETIEKQIDNFKKGFPFANIISPANYEKGILKLSENEVKKLAKDYDEKRAKYKTVKFVPASGAASRMFKDLFEFLSEDKNETENKSLKHFFENIENFAFYEDLKISAQKNNINLKTNLKEIINNLLSENGLNYGNLPKGLLKFHKYENSTKTPAEEHIYEAKEYTLSENNIEIHFTVSPEHLPNFEKLFADLKNQFKEKFNIVLKINITEQKKSTDTIAVDSENNPFREKDGSLLFRPGGHGALIENLNEIDADIIFVKNIDNVVPERNNSDTILYKKALGGLTIKFLEEIKYHRETLKNDFSPKALEKAEEFLERNFNLKRKYSETCFSERKGFVVNNLDRPLRICGMVKNEGEPGGGPFFVLDKYNEISLQIVESSQIDLKDEEKNSIFKNSTHFNPVDLVLYVKDFQGNKFDLKNYIDNETGFISIKSKDGKELKAMELPGLWNGAMAYWNTIFVEVPASTFNPVKTVNDLLRKMHN